VGEGGASLDTGIQELAAELRVIGRPLMDGTGAKTSSTDHKMVVGNGLPLVEVVTLE